MVPSGLVVRELRPGDSLGDLTELLHRAYSGLARRGLWYVATHQDEDTTRHRVAAGTCLVALLDGRLVGTVTLERAKTFAPCAWYQRADVASCSQLGVEPDVQRLRIGTLLMDLVEERAWRAGAHEIALDTAEQADDLIAWYGRRGYRLVENVDWEATNYQSVVLSKRLTLPDVSIRAVPADEGLLASMLAECVNWDPSRPRIADADVMGRSELRGYVEGFGRRGDAGVLAQDGSGTALGAAWFRTFRSERPGFGFVAEDIPEACIAVRRPWRGHGLGGRLLAALEQRARRSGERALSLSVEEANPALRLYRRRGYRTVATVGGTHTMLLSIDPSRPS